MKDRIRNSLFTVLTFSFLFLGVDCKDDPPVKDDGNIPPDSTTQDFEITAQELGVDGPTSFLKDVWIFSPENIWAVGDVYIPSDSQEVTYKEYNIVQWNGSKWEGRGYLFNSNGVESLWALDSSSIYFAAGYLFKYSQGIFTEFDITNLNIQNGQRVEKIWGASEQNICGVGKNGMIVRFNGIEWKKIEFPLGWNFRSITGSKTTGVAYATAESLGIYGVIRLNMDSTQFIYRGNQTYTYDLQNIRMVNENELWFTGNPIRRYKIAEKTFQELYEGTNGYFTQVMGIATEQDIYFWGDNFSNQLLTHYNGKRFTQIILPYRDYVFEYGAYAITNLAMMVSQSNNNAYIVTVKRR